MPRAARNLSLITSQAGAVDDVVDAIRSFQSQNDLWQLADALAAKIPNGTTGVDDVSFGDIIEAATKEGVLGKLSAKTLQLYRDTSVRWPSTNRVPGVSFSAHREAQAMAGDVDAKTKLLADLVKSSGGADKVSIASVRAQVRKTQGKQAPAGNAPSGSIKNKGLSLNDLMNGGSEMIKAIHSNTPSDELDKLQAGLTKVLAHVERLRSKAAQRAAKSSPKAPSSSSNAPTPISAAKRAAPKGGAGDLRGL